MDLMLAMKMAGLVVGACMPVYRKIVAILLSWQCAIEDLNETKINLVISRYLGGWRDNARRGWLANTPYWEFQQDSVIYGPSITFYRTIIDSGPSAVYIKDHKDNVVKKSTKEAREEGKRILENSEQKLCQLLKFSDSRKISSSSSKTIGKFPRITGVEGTNWKWWKLSKKKCLAFSISYMKGLRNCIFLQVLARQ